MAVEHGVEEDEMTVSLAGRGRTGEIIKEVCMCVVGAGCGMC